MANAVFPKYKEAVLSSASDSSLTAGTVKAILVDTGTYTYSAAHQYLSSLSGTAGTAQTIGSKSVTSGTFDGADVTFTSVAAGASLEAIVIYIDTGNSATSRLVSYQDTGVTGLPVTPNGGNITITWDASGIFTL